MKCSRYFLFTLVLPASVAFSSGEGLYLGVNAVQGTIDIAEVVVNNTAYTPSSENTFGGGLSLGYQPSEHVAIDAALDGLNMVNFDGENAPTQSYWFSYLAVKPILHAWKLNAFVSIGAAYVSISQNNSGNTPDTDHSMVRPYGGAGFGINFNPSTEMSFSINRIEDTKTPITFGMISLTYHFVDHYESSGFLAD
ncbi:MAG: outer membrane beta-barrel protein [Gammaproteobacteria bacterium]|nr:outer membrane beta-barrel protein [Gammaproteobacteria bacterium]MCD8542972.1 outer membrane beta-barrel protein [Gammaproteobacteria bacterium]